MTWSLYWENYNYLWTPFHIHLFYKLVDLHWFEILWPRSLPTDVACQGLSRYAEVSFSEYIDGEDTYGGYIIYVSLMGSILSLSMDLYCRTDMHYVIWYCSCTILHLIYKLWLLISASLLVITVCNCDTFTYDLIGIMC